MREDRIFAIFAEYSFYAVFAALVGAFVLDKISGSQYSQPLILALTLIPLAGLIAILPVSSRKTRLLSIAVIAEMLVALYLAF